ncbi:2-oxoglutarate dehydrogenase E1 component [Rubrobacter indicoceani]|uniref:2-oxoglutarate dehydrogenase E1 component n=1 Tax=Rubrobacter indicoceani TaxID=2051957 RepID=UPI000E5C4366|nr:2-oxoglutarate dehydrogenase E1 component [Rubrobacter indicoceani]
MQQRLGEFQGPNLGYVLGLYESFRQDPDSVDAETRRFFEGWQPPEQNGSSNGVAGGVVAPGGVNGATASGVDVDKVIGAAKYVRSIRDFGHSAAQLDPLGTEPPGDPALDVSWHEISDDDLRQMPASVVGGTISENTGNAFEAVRELRRIYCDKTGYDFGHIAHLPEERFWLRDAVESERFSKSLNETMCKWVLKRLTRVETFERFLHRTFLGQKRFSVEGNDIVVPMLDRLMRLASDAGTPEVVMGMAHRGRLNVLAHVLNKPYASIFSEFQQPDRSEGKSMGGGSGQAWVGDVKYHLGIRNYHLKDEEATSQVLINLAPNPSHLEHVNPVALGMTRAAQEKRSRAGAPVQDFKAAFNVILHGDAAFIGEGVCAESLNLSKLPGYTTGGAIHVITNNQLGFTTESRDSRSTTYASDLAKGYEIPVVHVNADDPEACMAAISMAFAYREKFHKDFMIDLIGYRRFGHNEGDEPAYTQPQMYEKIKSHPTVRELWAATLEERGVIEAGEADRLVEEVYQRMTDIHKGEASDVETEEETVADEPHTPLVDIPKTGVEQDRIRKLNAALLERPGDFTPNGKLDRMMQKNRGNLDSIDWAHAESLAFGTLIEDGTAVRLTGQDSQRGTFSHRHAVLHDEKTGGTYVPLQNVPDGTASFDVYNSPLSEIAVMGFEYGYSMNTDDSLLVWEAQYGDFANVAQPMIDQFIVSGQAKWGSASELVMLLPHGYEGNGPEHSSARLERFLQLAAHENLRIANLTTAAQYFHILRAQAILLEHQRPLVIMAPKSLLRHPMSASTLEDLSDGQFMPVIDDAKARERAKKVKRLILCSGKFYTELEGADDRDAAEEVAIGRIELLYPFPKERVQEMISAYPNLEEVVWAQEEPKNMGAWFFMEPRLRELLGGVPVLYVGKPARPSPAQGSGRFHKQEHAAIVADALSGRLGGSQYFIAEVEPAFADGMDSTGKKGSPDEIPEGKADEDSKGNEENGTNGAVENKADEKSGVS